MVQTPELRSALLLFPLSKNSSKQLGRPTWLRNYLAERFAQTQGGMRGIIARVIVEHDVHFFDFSSEILASCRHLFDFVVRIIVVEPRGNGFASDVSISIAPMESQVSDLLARNRVQGGRHHGEVITGRGVNISKTDAPATEKLQGSSKLLSFHPVAVSKLYRD